MTSFWMENLMQIKKAMIQNSSNWMYSRSFRIHTNLSPQEILSDFLHFPELSQLLQHLPFAHISQNGVTANAVRHFNVYFTSAILVTPALTDCPVSKHISRACPISVTIIIVVVGCPAALIFSISN